MYLFTFLATVALLSIVGACLLWRAIVVRRRFHRQVVEAIMRGEPIPNFRSPFITRLPTPPKKEIVLGPMPRMWQSEMRRDDLDKHEEEKGEWAREEDGWKHLNVSPKLGSRLTSARIATRRTLRSARTASAHRHPRTAVYSLRAPRRSAGHVASPQAEPTPRPGTP